MYSNSQIDETEPKVCNSTTEQIKGYCANIQSNRRNEIYVACLIGRALKEYKESNSKNKSKNTSNKDNFVTTVNHLLPELYKVYGKSPKKKYRKSTSK